MKTHLWDHVEFQGCLILGGCDCAKFFPRPIQNSPRPTRPASALLVCAVLPPEPRQFCTSTYYSHMGMGQYLLIPFLVGWTSIYQLFWCSPGIPGFWSIPIYTYKVTQVHTYSRSTKCMHVWLLCNLCNVAFIIIHTCNVVKYCFNAQPESSTNAIPSIGTTCIFCFKPKTWCFVRRTVRKPKLVHNCSLQNFPGSHLLIYVYIYIFGYIYIFIVYIRVYIL